MQHRNWAKQRVFCFVEKMVKRLTGFFSWKMGKAKTTPASTKELRRSNSFWKPNQKRECLFPKHSTVARSIFRTDLPRCSIRTNKWNYAFLLPRCSIRKTNENSRFPHFRCSTRKNKRKCTFPLPRCSIRKSKRKCAFSAFQMLRSKKQTTTRVSRFSDASFKKHTKMCISPFWTQINETKMLFNVSQRNIVASGLLKDPNVRSTRYSGLSEKFWTLKSCFTKIIFWGLRPIFLFLLHYYHRWF